MINNCTFCSLDSAGNHQFHCPSHKRETDFVGFLNQLGSDSNIELRPFDSLIEKYMGLMSAYMMTVDLLEVAGETFGAERLDTVASYILTKLDECISAITALQEREYENDERDDEE